MLCLSSAIAEFHVTSDLYFLSRKKHITMDMYFAGRETQILNKEYVFPRLGNTYHYGNCVSRESQVTHFTKGYVFPR